MTSKQARMLAAADIDARNAVWPQSFKTLPELAEQAITASMAFRSLPDSASDAEWADRDVAMIDARFEFHRRLCAVTGLTGDQFDQLMREGVL